MTCIASANVAGSSALAESGRKTEAELTRTRQSNLFGPAGFVSADDGEVLEMTQQGATPSPDAHMILQMGGRAIESTDHQVTETAVRGMYRYWRKVMGL